MLRPSKSCVTGKGESPMWQKPGSGQTIAITIITDMTGGVIIVTLSFSSTGAGGVGGTAGGIQPGVTIPTTNIMITMARSTGTAGFRPTRSSPVSKANCSASDIIAMRWMALWDH